MSPFIAMVCLAVKVFGFVTLGSVSVLKWRRIIFEAVAAVVRWEDEKKKWKEFKYLLVLGKHVVKAQTCDSPVSEGVPKTWYFLCVGVRLQWK